MSPVTFANLRTDNFSPIVAVFSTRRSFNPFVAIVGSHYNGTTKKVDYQLLPVNVTFEDDTALPVDPVADINL